MMKSVADKNTYPPPQQGCPGKYSRGAVSFLPLPLAAVPSGEILGIRNRHLARSELLALTEYRDSEVFRTRLSGFNSPRLQGEVGSPWRCGAFASAIRVRGVSAWADAVIKSHGCPK